MSTLPIIDKNSWGANTNCVVCANQLKHTPAISIQNSSLHECVNCQSYTLLPRLQIAQQLDLHNSDEYFAHKYFELRRHDLHRAIERSAIAQNYVGKIIDATQNVRLLDLGCDNGLFMYAMQQQFGYSVSGIDISERASLAARNQFGLNVLNTTIENAPDNLSGFDVITAIDFVEHVVRPKTLFEEVYKRLVTGGVFYFETPNIFSLIYRTGFMLGRICPTLFKSQLERLFPLQHCQYFSPKGILFLSQLLGFEIVAHDRRILIDSDLNVSCSVLKALKLLQLVDNLYHNQVLDVYLLQKTD